MKKNSLSALLALCSALFISTPSYAAPQHFPAVDQASSPATLWRVTFYDDTANNHTQWATQDICFLQGPVQGSNTTGIWYSTTYYRWIGRWRQEGDQVKMTGNFWTDRGNDAMSWEIAVVDREGHGHWDEWVDNGTYGAWLAKGNAKFVKLGTCAWQPPITVTVWAEIERLVLQQAELAPRRVRADGTDAYPSDRLQLPQGNK